MGVPLNPQEAKAAFCRGLHSKRVMDGVGVVIPSPSQSPRANQGFSQLHELEDVKAWPETGTPDLAPEGRPVP